MEPGIIPPDHATDETVSDWWNDPLWYKDAIIYELHVKAFFDANNDGTGDFRGLTEKLDYVKDLGVNTIWLLPFYPSPFRDDGYDISDYHNVDAQYGTRADFKQFIREAHRRKLKVITELVINHTSDQHPWFQAARFAPPGSSKRDFYVWSDTDKKFDGTRIIFTDTEKSQLGLGRCGASLLLAPLLFPPAGSQSQQSGRGEGRDPRDAFLARHGCRRTAPRRNSLSLRP